jgi:hypothetical protein
VFEYLVQEEVKFEARSCGVEPGLGDWILTIEYARNTIEQASYQKYSTFGYTM